MKIKLDEGAYMPTRAHRDDAGLDLHSPVDKYIIGGRCAVIDTGVHIELPRDTVGIVAGRSGMNFKNSVNLGGIGIIDENYRGSIGVKLYNNSDDPLRIKAGDRIAQLLIMPVIKPDLEQVDELDDTDRGSNGYGSSGK